jgi:threonine dehydratase
VTRGTPTVLEVFAARRRLAPYGLRSPLRHSAWLSRESGGEVWLKLESLQPTHSFKVRGALNAALSLGPAAAGRTIVTASAGNHGRALAWAGARLGFRPVVFAPASAPRSKLDAIAAAADLRLAADYDAAEREAKAYAASGGHLWLSPFNHPDIVAATGTIALELVEDLPEVDVVVVPVGGGGLVSGIGLTMKAVAPHAEIVGVEVEASHPFTASLAAGHIVRVTVGPSLADGLVGNLDPETITFELARRVVDRFVLVSEDDLVAGLRGLVAHEHLVAEGAGVAALAAILARRVAVDGRRAVAIVSGANIDRETLARLL